MEFEHQLKESALKIQAMNDNFYQQQLRKYKKLELEYNNNITKTAEPLIGAEKSFLKYVNNRPINASLPAYWFYEYGFNVDELLKKLFTNGYLCLSNNIETLNALTTNELKSILKQFNLIQSGKKADLINRLKENVAEPKLEPFVNNKFSFMATEKGMAIINTTPESLTKDIDFENKCLMYILNRDFDAANTLIYQRELNKPSSFNTDSDCQQQLKHTISPERKHYYTKILKSTKESNSQIKACVVLLCMLGTSTDRLKYLFSRITTQEYTSKEAYSVYTKLTQAYQRILDTTKNLDVTVPCNYSIMQINNDLRILNDCISIMQSTDNLDTFLKRYDLATKKALILQQAQKYGLETDNFIHFDTIIKIKQKNIERILQSIYEKNLSAINNFKTPKSKINKINKLLEMLSEYDYELETINDYNWIINNLNSLKENLQKEYKIQKK